MVVPHPTRGPHPPAFVAPVSPSPRGRCSVHAHRRWTLRLATAVAALLTTARLPADDAVRALDVVEELPTLHCLGVRWRLAGDDNTNATITMRYRTVDPEAPWRTAQDLMRVESAAMLEATRPPTGHTWFAGSILDLTPDTAYAVLLDIHDPDGGATNTLLHMRTWVEPRLPAGAPRRPITTNEWPHALLNAQPGEILVLQPGVYSGTVTPPSGAPGHPIGLIGPRKGTAILDGRGSGIVHAPGLSHVTFEGLTFRNADFAIAVNEGAHITIRHCRFENVRYAFVGSRNHPEHAQERFFITDNELEGRASWPRVAGLSGGRGIQLSGRGHVVAYNRIRDFDDAIVTFSDAPCAGIDIFGNDITACIDDGIEMDFSEHNTRCFDNRITSVFMGISTQPVYGGPVYIFRNVIYNVSASPFKLHNAPSGVQLLHNTTVRLGAAMLISATEPVSNSRSRNNLFVGTASHYAFEAQSPMQGCDFDYDGFVCDFDLFLKWNEGRYGALADAQVAGLYPHGLVLVADSLFEEGFAMPEHADTLYGPLRNAPVLGIHSMALDRGQTLANVNDGYVGAAPDLGAYERGRPIPPYGPRPRGD